MTPNYRADHVGSLLRPPEVLQAREDFREQRISQEQFKEIEDRAVLAATHDKPPIPAYGDSHNPAALARQPRDELPGSHLP